MTAIQIQVETEEYMRSATEADRQKFIDWFHDQQWCAKQFAKIDRVRQLARDAREAIESIEDAL